MEKNYRWIFPHVKGTMTTAGMMRMMLLALLPAEIFGVLSFRTAGTSASVDLYCYLYTYRIYLLKPFGISR